jgi:hypothetical protein
MAITDTQKVDYLWKKIGYGRAKTDTGTLKNATNESISSPLLLRGDKIWAQSDLIPAVLPGSTSGVVTVYPTSAPVECEVDITSSTNRTWKTNITDWIPPEIGSTYLVKVYLHTPGSAGSAASSGTQIFGAGSGNNDEWFFDYQSGTLNFIGTNLPSDISGKIVYISGGVYNGLFGVSAPGGASSFTDLFISGISTLSGLLYANSGADIKNIRIGIATDNKIDTTTGNLILDSSSGFTEISDNLYVSGISTFVGVGTFQSDLYVGGNLGVKGYSEFVGVVTFKGGTINLGDDNTDNIVVSGEFASSLIPTDDATYNLGTSAKRWNNASFAGVGTFATGAVVDAIQIGVTNSNTIDTTSGKLTLDSATQIVEVAHNINVLGDLDVTGNVYIGGTTVTLRGQDVLIENKDIVLGYTTSVTPSDDSANHAGVAIASTVGTPLTSFIVSGINTLPDTYKQMMWFKSGTLGFSTDAFAFNYGVAIGTTTMANGVRLAVGSGITMTDTEVSATNFYGNLIGNITSNVRIVGVTTIGTGVGITQFSSSVSTGNSTSSVPTSSAIIDYIDSEIGAVDLTLGLNADSGGPSTVNTSQTLTVNGTASEIKTSVSSQTITIGLPNAVVVGTSLSSPTIRTGTIQSSNTGATAITIDDNDVVVADDLTIQGNLYVNGNTTQVNTSALTIEDRTIELGRVDGSTPSSATTWDLGVLFNYNASGAKKSAVVWEHSAARFQFASVLILDADGTTVNTPQLSVSTFAPIEIGSLWVTDCAGTSQVISCTGSTRNLENITIDAGIF